MKKIKRQFQNGWNSSLAGIIVEPGVNHWNFSPDQTLLARGSTNGWLFWQVNSCNYKTKDDRLARVKFTHFRHFDKHMVWWPFPDLPVHAVWVMCKSWHNTEYNDVCSFSSSPTYYCTPLFILCSSVIKVSNQTSANKITNKTRNHHHLWVVFFFFF